MKYIFELDDNVENFDCKQLQRYLRIDDIVKTLIELSEKVRSYDKRDVREVIPVEEIVDVFWEVLQDNNINLDEIDFE